MSSSELPTNDRAALERAAMDAGRRLGAHSNAFWNAVAQHLGLSRTEWECLDVLDAEGPMAAGQLAEHTGLTTGAITGIVDRLVEQRLVTRQRDPNDRRRVIVTPSPERFAELGELVQPLLEGLQAWLKPYSDEELRAFIRMNEAAVELFRELRTTLRRAGRARGGA